MTVKCGNVQVKIYCNTPKNGHVSYTVRYRRGTEEIRETRSSAEDAHLVAQSAARSIANGELDVLTLRSDDRLSYVRALEALRPTGVTLEAAAEQYAKAHAMLRSKSLIDVVEFYMQRNPLSDAKTVAEVAKELVEQKRAMGRCEEHIKDLRLRLTRFANAFMCNISSVTTQQIEEFLLSLKVSGRTRNNFRRLVGTLLRFAIRRNYLPKDHPGIGDVELSTEVPGEIDIFTVDEMSKLLATASTDILPFVALGAFAGLRHAELKRLDWSDIRLADGHIELKAKDAKTRVRRTIPIAENLKQWLTPLAKPFGPVTPFANMSKQLLWLAEDAGVVWRHNALRHSFVSYRTAVTQNIPQVSYESGNSPRVIEKNYLKRVMPLEAQQWFAIRPATESNVVQLPKTVAVS